MKKELLPNYYQKIGLIFGLISILILTTYYFELELIKSSKDIIKSIFENILLASLLLIVFTKEKYETDKINLIRLGTLKRALIFGGLILIFESILKLIWNSDFFEIRSGYEIMIMILLFFLIIFKEKVIKIKPGHNNI